MATAVPIGNVEHAILDIHSILKAYYKVARNRFVDTVYMQGTDYHFPSGDDNPLRIFSSLFVSELIDKVSGSLLLERILARSGKKVTGTQN